MPSRYPHHNNILLHYQLLLLNPMIAQLWGLDKLDKRKRLHNHLKGHEVKKGLLGETEKKQHDHLYKDYFIKDSIYN